MNRCLLLVDVHADDPGYGQRDGDLLVHGTWVKITLKVQKSSDPREAVKKHSCVESKLRTVTQDDKPRRES